MEIFGVYGLDSILIGVVAVFFYKAAAMAQASRFLWTGPSVVVSFAKRILGGG